MMLLWACAGVPLGAYNIAGDFNIALQIQPQILTVLSLITWIQCYYYDDVSSLFPVLGIFVVTSLIIEKREHLLTDTEMECHEMHCLCRCHWRIVRRD